MGLSDGERILMMHSAVLTNHTCDRQTDGIGMYAVARKNVALLYFYLVRICHTDCLDSKRSRWMSSATKWYGTEHGVCGWTSSCC